MRFPLPPQHSWHKRQGKSERDRVCRRGRRERQCAGISGSSPENVQQGSHDSKETIYPLSPRLRNQGAEALGSVWHSGQRHERGTASWEGHFPDTGESLEERSRVLPTTSHTQLSYLHLKSSCIKILRCSKSIINNARGTQGDDTHTA